MKYLKVGVVSSKFPKQKCPIIYTLAYQKGKVNLGLKVTARHLPGR
jgi:hypothetical protein